MFYHFAQLPFFLNPGLWPWLAAASAPLIIHFLARRQYQEVSWAAMQYLLNAVKRTSRRVRIEQWLLLLIRTLILLLIIFAAMQPAFKSSSILPIFESGQRVYKIIVIDGSFSMASKPNEKTLFEDAKTIAQELVQGSSQGDGFSLMLMSDPPQIVIRRPTFEKNAAITEIQDLRLPDLSADLMATVTQLEQMIELAGKEGTNLPVQIYFISDLGLQSWFRQYSGDTLDRLRTKCQKLSKIASVNVIDIGRDNLNNLAITDLKEQSPFITIDSDIAFSVRIQNLGRTPANQKRVEFVVDGQVMGEKSIDVAAGEEETVSFDHKFLTSGAHLVEARLEEDVLTVDNHRYRSVFVREHLSVLCINGRPSGELFAGSVDHLVAALAPKEYERYSSRIKPDVATENAILEINNLSQYDVIFLCDVKMFTHAENRRLVQYLKDGGVCIFFLGERVIAESYNQWLYGEDSQAERILPARLVKKTKAASRTQPFKIDPLNYDHPVLKTFEGNTRSGLLNTSVQTYFQVEVPEGSSARSIMGITNGDPLVIEEELFSGRSILVTTSADKSWTTMPLVPSYVPTIHELLLYSVANRADEFNDIAGTTMSESLKAVQADFEIETSYSGHHEKHSIDSEGELIRNGDLLQYSLSNTNFSGAYSVDYQAPINRRSIFVLNPDPRESELTKMVPSDWATVWPELNVSDTLTNPSSQSFEAIQQSMSGNSFPTTLLYLVLAFLFIETVLAWRFGHHRTR